MGIFSPRQLDPRVEEITHRNYQILLNTVRKDPSSFRFFTGAGTSIGEPARMPSSAAFQKRCLRTLTNYSGHFSADLARMTDDTDLGMRANVEALPLEALIQYLKDIAGEDVLALFQVYASAPAEHRANSCHRFLATWLAQGYGAVATTNIDHLIEDAWPDGSGQMRVFGDLSHFPSSLEAGHLYKLHGTVESLSSLRFSLDRILPVLPKSAAELLDAFVRSGPLCFVGYAGADLDLRPIIQGRPQSSDSPLFYCIYPDKDNQTEEELREKNRKAFDLIDATAGLPIYADSNCLFSVLGHDIFGWDSMPCEMAQPQFDWGQMEAWARTTAERKGTDYMHYIAGRLAGFIYLHLGLYDDAIRSWDTLVRQRLVTDHTQLSGIYRDMAHAHFRVPNIRAALKVNRLGLREAAAAGNLLAEAECLFGVGSVPVAWPSSSPVGFLLAPLRLRRAADLFAQVRQAQNDASIGSPERRLRAQAAYGEATCLYWFARWQQRFLAPLLPRSTHLRQTLVQLYQRSADLLRDPEVNAVNELTNPTRSLALVLRHDNLGEAKRLAQEAESLARWTGDQQRLATVLRDVARVYASSRDWEDLNRALGYWLEVLHIATQPSPSNPDRLTDPNGVSLAYQGLTAIYLRMSGEHIRDAIKNAVEGGRALKDLHLPRSTKAIHRLQLAALRARALVAQLGSRG